MKNTFRWAALSLFSTSVFLTASEPLLAANKKDPNPKKDPIGAYRKAKDSETANPATSCKLYSQLSKQDFALKSLSLVKAHLYCPESKKLDPVPADLVDKEPWLATLDIERQLVESERDKDFKTLAEAQLKKSQRIEVPREKVKWVQMALETSGKIENVDPAFQAELISRLFKLAPRFQPNPAPEQYFEVGMDLINQREFTKGRSYLKKIMASSKFSTEEQYLARRAYRNSFKTEQKKDTHITEAGRLAEWSSKHGTAQRIHEAYTTWARAQWTQGRVKAAQKTLEDAEKILKKKNYALDEVYFIRARMMEEARKLDQALEWLVKAENASRPGTLIRDKILFSEAWILRKQGKFAEASEALLKLKNETQDLFDRNRYSFWLARSLKQAQKNTEAEKVLQELIQNDPLGYYGLVAYRELGQEIPPLKASRGLASSENSKPPIDEKDHALIQALAEAEESEILGKYLDLKTAELRSRSNSNQGVWFYYLKAYAQAGLYNPLFAQIGTLPVELRTQLLAQNPELLFPRKFLELIQTSAEKFQIRPELVLSIIRQESAFNPQARSGADALGLMQLLPSVARKHQKKTGVKIDHFEDLYEPESNIPLGTSLLADLSKKYRGQFLLIAAAYNANEKAIGTWLKTRLQDDPLEFIEDIPYEETRAYVKLVLRNFIFYSRLNNPSQSLPFPNWCLEDLQTFKVSTR